MAEGDDIPPLTDIEIQILRRLTDNRLFLSQVGDRFRKVGTATKVLASLLALILALWLSVEGLAAKLAKILLWVAGE
jgi:hypothetical protein